MESKRVLLFPKLLLAILMVVTLGISVVKPTHAGNTLSSLQDILSNENQNATGVQHQICFSITQAIGTSIIITPSTAYSTVAQTTTSDYTVSIGTSACSGGSPATITSVTVGTSGSTTTSIQLNDTGGFGGTNGQQVLVTFLAAATVGNQAAGNYTETITTGGGETGTLSIVIVSNDQVVVSGTVTSTLTFSISANSATIPASGNLALNVNTSSTVPMTFATNASGGGLIQVEDLNTHNTSSLYSSTAGYTIPAAPNNTNATTLAAEGFGIGAQAPSAGSVANKYLETGSPFNQVGPITTSLQTFWSSNGSVNSTTVSPLFSAFIAGTTPAGTYSDTVTFIASAKF